MFINNPQEAEKENEIIIGSRIVNLDSFLKKMNKCKSAMKGNIYTRK